MNKSESIKNLAGALTRAQAEMPVVKMDAKNPFLKYKYATLGALINACRPILAKNELSVVQFPVNDGDKVGVSTTLIHSSGEWIEDSVYIPTDEQKGLSTVQTVGVAITYLRRYSLASLLSMYADEDTDASEHDGYEKAPVQLEKRPSPENKAAEPTVQKLREQYGEKFFKAKNAGLKDLPKINGDSTEQEIKEQMAKLDEMLASSSNGKKNKVEA